MKTVNKKRIYITLIIGGVILGAFLSYGKYKKISKGYCAEEGRKLSDKELVEIAIATIYSKLNSEYSEMSGDTQRGAKQYLNPESIRLENPNCCNEPLRPFAGADKQQSELLLDKSGYFYEGSIFLQLDEVEADEPKVSQFKPRVDYTITSCGRLREWRVYNSKFYTKNGVSGGS